MNYEKKQKIPFGAFDSELMRQEISIPDGFEAVIEENKIILKKIESEDERIREYLIRYIDNTMKSSELKSKLLAWLEKQDPKKHEEELEKAYKTADEVQYRRGYEAAMKEMEKQGEQPKEATYTHEEETGNGNIKALVTEKVQLPKFKVGDWIVNDYCMGKVIRLTDDAYLLDSGQGIPFSCEHNAHLWTIQDAKDGDILFAKGSYFKEYTFIYSGMTEDNVLSTYCGFDIAHNNFDNKLTRFGRVEDLETVYPATKEQRDLLFQKMKEAGYEWDAENLQLTKILHIKELSDGINIDKQKSAAWSEEDEEYINDLIGVFDGQQYQAHSDEEIVKWIKSIRLPYNKEWDENDEEMLRSIIATCELAEQDRDSSPARHLLEMQLNWLKSLKQRIGGEQ